MNQFKKDLNYELQSVSLSPEKKQLIAKKATSNVHGRKRRTNWNYRFVLATFTLFACGFSYLLWQQDNPIGSSGGAAPMDSVTTTSWSMLTNDYFKAISLVSIIIVLRFLLKRNLRKNGKDLPVCVKCGEEWPYKKALRQSMKNTVVSCPSCGQQQYRTKKSTMKAGILNLFIPFGIIMPQFFDNFLLGIVVHLVCTVYIFMSLTPYYVEFQEGNPYNDPLW